MPDISIDSDLIFGIMDLVQAEHHTRFSYLSTKRDDYLKLLNWIRELRTKRMQEIEKPEESQWHCDLKHLLSACYRFFEVGDKYLASGDAEKAKSYYEDAYSIMEKVYEFNYEKPQTVKKNGYVIGNIKKIFGGKSNEI